MFFDMCVAQESGLVLFFAKAFNAQPLCRFAAFLTGDFGHLVARQQGNGVLAGGLALASIHDFDVSLGGGAKIIEMPQHQTGLENRVGLARLANICAAPAADGELTQVATALQPDGTQVFIQFIQGGRADHFQVEPEIFVMSILDAQMPDRFHGAGALQCNGKRCLPLGAFLQMSTDAAPGDDFAAVGAGSGILGFSGHRLTLPSGLGH